MTRGTLLETIKKHSRRVQITKHSLPVFAFLIASLIVLWPLFNQEKEKFTLAVLEPGQSKVKVEMENLRFFGLNDKNFPMTLTSPEVQEEPTNPELARMKKPIGTYQLDSDDTLILNSPYALIHQKNQTVFFEDRVQGKTDSGYTIQTSQVLCDYNTGTADSDSPVSVNGPMGKLNAQGVWMADRGNLILFKKKTTSVINNKNKKINVYSTNGLQIDQKQRTMTAMENAKVVQDGNTLKADKLVLHYTDNKKDRIKKIEAFGHVTLNNKKQKATADQGVYYPKEQKANMQENVVITQGKNTMRGKEALINLAKGTSELIAPERITGQLVPKEIKGDTK